MSDTRRLAAILAADVAGYSRLMAAGERGLLDWLKSLRVQEIDPLIAQYFGRIVGSASEGRSDAGPLYLFGRL